MGLEPAPKESPGIDQRCKKREELERMSQGSACEDRDMKTKGAQREQQSSVLLPGWGLAEERKFHET